MTITIHTNPTLWILRLVLLGLGILAVGWSFGDPEGAGPGFTRLALSCLLAAGLMFLLCLRIPALALDRSGLRMPWSSVEAQHILELGLLRRTPHPRLDSRLFGPDVTHALCFRIAGVRQPVLMSLIGSTAALDLLAIRLSRLLGHRFVDRRAEPPLEIGEREADMMWMRANLVPILGLTFLFGIIALL